MDIRTSAITFGIGISFFSALGHSQAKADSNALRSVPARLDKNYAEGEVRRINLDSGKITLKHGVIANLGMPSMTMVFKMEGIKGAENVKTGDKVRFKADSTGGAYIVTELILIP
jgi:Cu(I)/Ag(I) efflux system periplasmic protein CusF